MVLDKKYCIGKALGALESAEVMAGVAAISALAAKAEAWLHLAELVENESMSFTLRDNRQF